MGLFGYGPADRGRFKAKEDEYKRLLQPHALWKCPAENGVSEYDPAFDASHFGFPLYSAQMLDARPLPDQLRSISGWADEPDKDGPLF